MRETTRKVAREEKKFLITAEEASRCCGQLEKLLRQDPHNGAEGYRIRSLYFDTLEDRDFFDKQEGVEVRKKIRLRLYDPASDFAMLEMKQKQGSNQLKRSLRLCREDAERLAAGCFSPLLSYESAFAAECYAVMNMEYYRPKAIVEYNRKAFIASENNIRLTFDSRITATESSFDLFSPKLCLYPVFDRFQVILEVKYNRFLLSYIKDIISQCDKSELSASKYCLGRSAGLDYLF